MSFNFNAVLPVEPECGARGGNDSRQKERCLASLVFPHKKNFKDLAPILHSESCLRSYLHKKRTLKKKLGYGEKNTDPDL